MTDNSAFYPSRVMTGGSVVTTLKQKRPVFPAFSSREVTLGRVCKTGILFIIYHKLQDRTKHGLIKTPLPAFYTLI